MTARRATFWASRRLETRIGAAIVLAIVAILALALLQLTFMHRPEFVVFQREWLTKAVAEAFDVADRAPASERAARLHKLHAAAWLTFAWSGTEPRMHSAPRPPPPQLDHTLEAELKQALAGRAQTIGVRFGGHHPHQRSRPDRPPPPPSDLETASLQRMEPPPRPPPDRRLGSESSFRFSVIPPVEHADAKLTRQDVVPAIFDIRLQLSDASWLRIMPNAHERGWPMDLPLLLFGGAVVVVALSVATARRTLAPLSELTAAAKRLGPDRAQSPISTEGLNEFTPIAAALNEMHARLSKYVDERTQMLAAISHDMRTSLTRLSLSIEEVSDAGLKSTLSREVAEMTSMISATLAFARNDSQVEPAADVDLAALLISLCDEASDEGHRAEYRGPDHLTLRCQRLLLKRALTNVIENAVKYGGEAVVSLSGADAGVVVEIADKGPGIPPDEREKAFEPFQRLEWSRNRSTGGVGLGLTIARDAVHSHGGSIALANAPGGGLLVRLALPG